TVLLAACSRGEDTGSASFDSDNDGSPDSEDCDDENADVHPGAGESCNNLDDDCDGEIDEDPAYATIWHMDADGDGYGIDDLGFRGAGEHRRRGRHAVRVLVGGRSHDDVDR